MCASRPIRLVQKMQSVLMPELVSDSIGPDVKSNRGVLMDLLL